MKECPACKKNTIPIKWILFNKHNNKNCMFIKCTNCGKDIRKKAFSLFSIFFDWTMSDLVVIFIVSHYLSKLFQSYFVSLFVVVLVWIIVHYLVQYYSQLEVASEEYIKGYATKGEALVLTAIVLLILGTGIYKFIIEPFFYSLHVENLHVNKPK